jgi:hypothetical protein
MRKDGNGGIHFEITIHTTNVTVLPQRETAEE